jgi:hypothetical protein|tara:strand:- start:90 stop:476 length:387 start_codon:yes stop_codon:yes gene_type:complete
LGWLSLNIAATIFGLCAKKCYQPKLGQVDAQGIHKVHAPSNYILMRSERDSTALGCHTHYSSEPHGRTYGSLRDGFCIRVIIVPALYERLPIRSWHEPHLMTVALRKSAPVMRRRSGLHCHYVRRLQN